MEGGEGEPPDKSVDKFFTDFNDEVRKFIAVIKNQENERTNTEINKLKETIEAKSKTELDFLRQSNNKIIDFYMKC